MELRTTFQIPTLIKAMTDVVLPALDPNNKLAQEQGQLILGSLHLIAQRLPLQYRYDRHELGSFLALAEQLEQMSSGAPELAVSIAALRASSKQGREVLARAGAEPSELESANLAMRDSIGAITQAGSALPDDARRKRVESAVMAHAREMLLRERAWLAMQGWEGKNVPLPDVESLIGR